MDRQNQVSTTGMRHVLRVTMGRIRRRAGRGPLLLVLAVAPVGCGAEEKECLTIACGPNLSIQLTEPLSAAGAYRLEITSDGVRAECNGAMPADAGAWRCGLATYWIETDASGALTAANVELEARPRSVTVTLLRDDTPIVVETFEPSYRGDEAGEGRCGTCYQATVRLDTSAP